MDPALFDVLKNAWAVWEPVMRNTDVLETVMFTDMDASCTAFSETSDLHALAAELYWVWSTSSTKASAMLVPPTSADRGLCYQLLYGRYPDSKGITGSVTIHGLFARYPSNPARTCVH